MISARVAVTGRILFRPSLVGEEPVSEGCSSVCLGSFSSRFPTLPES
jgi:hypothetical protein